MFEFYGKLSDEVLKKSSRQQNKFISILFFIISLSSIGIGVFFLIFDVSIFLKLLPATLLFIIITIALFLCPPKSAIYKFPRKIIFNFQENIIKQEIEQLNSKPYIRKLSDIKTIYNFKDYYFITFKKDISDNLVCQKDLLVLGSLQHFENLFEDKIINKIA